MQDHTVGALFLDRDGTIIVDTHYPRDPAAVTLVSGAAEAIRTANARGIPVVVVTNQSGIGRGYLTLAEYRTVHERMVALLAAAGAVLDATYYCPHAPDVDAPCRCRKPGPAMFEQAARELQLDLARSAYIGDRWRDIEAGVSFGGLGILVPSRGTAREDGDRAEREPRAEVQRTIGDAVTRAIAFIGATEPVGETRSTP